MRFASLKKSMKTNWYIWVVLLCLSWNTARADEAFDPMLFGSEDEAGIGSNDLYNIQSPQAPQSIAPAAEMNIQFPQKPPANLKPMDEDDLLFEEDDTLNNSGEVDAPALNPAVQKPTTREMPRPEQPQAPLMGPQMPIQQARQPKINPQQGLTDTFLSNGAEKKVDLSLPIPNVENTWLGKITEKAGEKVKEKTSSTELPTSGNEGLEKLMNDTRKGKQRANASVFDISGIMLRMSKEQIEATMKKRHFSKVSESYEVPNFIKWRNEEKCRNKGVLGYERLRSCVIDLAKKEQHQYTETIHFSRFETKEELSVKMTSNFTNNKVYRIVYKSLSPSITGNSQKSKYLRNIKIYDFWKKVNQKYGVPDNKDEVTWGLGGNKPYLKAASGFLLLEDPMLRELDFTRMSREDQRFMNTDLYNF